MVRMCLYLYVCRRQAVKQKHMQTFRLYLYVRVYRYGVYMGPMSIVLRLRMATAGCSPDNTAALRSGSLGAFRAHSHGIGCGQWVLAYL